MNLLKAVPLAALLVVGATTRAPAHKPVGHCSAYSHRGENHQTANAFRNILIPTAQSGERQ